MLAEAASRDDEVELDEVAPHDLGTPLRLDPDNPRRAIPCVATIAKRAAEARLDNALALEARSRDLAALAAKGMPGAAEALASVEVEQAGVIEAARDAQAGVAEKVGP